MGNPKDFYRKTLEHQNRYNIFFAKAQALQNSQDEWEVVLLFYSALLLCTAYIISKELALKVQDHDERKKFLKSCSEITDKYSPKHPRNPLFQYETLKTLSESVR